MVEVETTLTMVVSSCANLLHMLPSLRAVEPTPCLPRVPGARGEACLPEVRRPYPGEVPDMRWLRCRARFQRLAEPKLEG